MAVGGRKRGETSDTGVIASTFGSIFHSLLSGTPRRRSLNPTATGRKNKNQRKEVHEFCVNTLLPQGFIRTVEASVSMTEGGVFGSGTHLSYSDTQGLLLGVDGDRRLGPRRWATSSIYSCSGLLE